MTLNILLGIVGPFQLMIIFLFYLPLFCLLPIILCVKRAEKVNQSKIVWGILGFFLNYIAVLVLYLLPTEQNTKQCPYCGEKILPTAKKCKHCGEWLESK